MIARQFKLILLSAFLFIAFVGVVDAQVRKNKKYVVNGYVNGYSGLVKVEDIDAEKLTHINYAFVNVKDSAAILTNLKTDSTNFRRLNELKKINPDLKILISIGGWSWSENFSDAVLTPTSRVTFAKSSVDIVRQYKLDGVDIDWEYPGAKGEDNVFRPEDKQNFTLMFKEIRKELDKLSAETGKKYELTAALGASKGFISRTEMAEVGKILDYLFLMTYDFTGPGSTIGHHTNLYSNSANGSGASADQAIKDFIAAGVPANKLGIGVAFYGKAFQAPTTDNHGMGQQSVKDVRPAGGGFTKLKESMINKSGYKRYWDKKAKAPYLFNADTKVFISYDDERSTKLKSKYVKKNDLAGVFFWQYFSDPKEHLLNVIDKTLP